MAPGRLVVLIALATACRRSEPVATRAAGAVEVAGPIDSHVHLAYWRVDAELARAGLAAAVDLGAPVDDVGAPTSVPVVWAGPMLTRPGGYPIDAWDPGGFGLGCAVDACAVAAIDAAAARGARAVKVVAGPDGLAPTVMAAAVAHAHARGLPVLAHALTDADAAAAAAAGCDGLAHTPVERLADATVAAWRGRVVVSTLAAFGGRADAVDNLRRLRAAGAVVLYGTDLGNRRVAGVDPDELALLAAAGLDGPAVVDALTTAPARFWHLEDALAATTVTLAVDPRLTPSAYAQPQAVHRR
ncbi:MAG: hypothetical protein R3B06_00345 [Kofleriaceae bacterium]